jgi:uncharacterized protein YecE (DUF72 family)
MAGPLPKPHATAAPAANQQKIARNGHRRRDRPAGRAGEVFGSGQWRVAHGQRTAVRERLARMETWIGTSGYNYPEWKGHFYPADLPASKMLPYYATRFRTVEINYTFYRMPTAKAIDGWLTATPETFRFTLKAPKRITHDRRLKDVGDLVRGFCDLASSLGPRLAALLFQLPPNLKCNLDVFDAFLDTLPPKVPAAFEFRNASWLEDPVYERLRARNLALCIADTGDKTTPIVETADYGYFRLRDEGYRAADIARWADEITAHAPRWREAFVYFKHEDEGKGPEFGQALATVLGQ